jgi:hypothetical protein
VKASLGIGGSLDLLRIPPQRPARAWSVRLPGGRLILTRDKGQSKLLANQVLMSSLRLIHRGPDGRIKDVIDAGSGLVTNAGVNLMSNDFSWTNCTLKQANYHAIGTGTTAAAASDVWLQTAQGTTDLSGTTNGYMTGTQSVIANATGTPYSPIYQTVATFTCNGGAGIAITEWIVAIGNWANVTHAATATSSTSLTDTTNSPFTASMVMGTVETGVTTPSNSSPTTQPMLQIASETSTVLTGLDNSWGSGTKTWLSLTNQAVSTPGATSNYVVFPTAWDRKVFGAVTLNSGDTLATTYQLSINSGG